MLGTFVKMQEALEDNVIEPSETQDMITSAINGLIAAAILSFMLASFYRSIK